jgi:mono/diheme cytochrome c family protein
MTNRSLRYTTVLLGVAALCGCGGSAPPAVDRGAAPAPGNATSAAAAAGAAVAPTSVHDGVYTEAQAQRGRDVFRTTCAECHGSRDFRGETFYLSWAGTTVGRLVDTMIESMPEDAPGSLPLQQYLDVTAYILSLNGYPAGGAELPAAADVLAGIRIERAARAGTR